MLKDTYTKYYTDKFSAHSYLDIYCQLFDKRKDSVLNVLEIGIQSGGSMVLWSELFPNAHIYGVDIKPLPPKFQLTDRMTHIVGNAYDVGFMNKYFENMKFDVMVDDGPHTLDSFLFFAKNYSKLLAPGGALVIEDIGGPNYVPPIKLAFPKEYQSKIKHITKNFNRKDNGKPAQDTLVYLEI